MTAERQAAGALLLELEGLIAGYDAPVIHGLSLRIRAGERIGLSGHNGAGKSTLLRAIVGTARCFGGRLRRAPGCRLGYLAQQSPDRRESPVKAREALELMGVAGDDAPARIARLLDTRLDRISAGERQLVLAWAVIHHDCALVLLDEPSSSLDEGAKSLLAAALAAFPPSRAALIISHDTDFLQAACTTVREFPAR